MSEVPQWGAEKTKPAQVPFQRTGREGDIEQVTEPPLLELTDTSMSDIEIAAALEQEVGLNVLHRYKGEEREIFLTHASLTSTRVIRYIPDLKTPEKYPRKDVAKTMEVTKLVEAARRELEETDKAGRTRELNSKLFDVFDAYARTNIVRAVEHLLRTHKGNRNDIVAVQRTILFMLSQQP